MSLEMKKTKSSEQDNYRYGGEKRRKHYAMEGIVDLGPHRVPDSDGTMKLCRFETTFRQERARRGRESTEGNCITTKTQRTRSYGEISDYGWYRISVYSFSVSVTPCSLCLCGNTISLSALPPPSALSSVSNRQSFIVPSESGALCGPRSTIPSIA